MSAYEYNDLFLKCQRTGLYHMFTFDIKNSKKIENTDWRMSSQTRLILNVYRNTGVLVFVVAMIIFVYYIIKLVYMLVKGRINDNIDLLNTVLILLGIILTVLVLMLGVAYNHIASCI